MDDSAFESLAEQTLARLQTQIEAALDELRLEFLSQKLVVALVFRSRGKGRPLGFDEYEGSITENDCV